MLFAGTTVVIAIVGLRIAGIPAIATMGLASAIAVAVAMVAAVTLLPALLGLAGTRIDKLHIGRRRAVKAEEAQRTVRRPLGRSRRPPPVALRHRQLRRTRRAGRSGPRHADRLPDDGTAQRDATYRKAYDLLAEGFGRGLQRSAHGRRRRRQRRPPTARVQQALSATDGIVFVSPPVVSPAGDTAVLTVIPAASPQDEATETLVHHLRDDVLPQALAGHGRHVATSTGQTAAFIDISERLSARLPLFIGAVVGLSFLLLMVVFRSMLVPLKAAVMNLLSIGAAYGVIVAVFQWGWGDEPDRPRTRPCRSARSCR